MEYPFLHVLLTNISENWPGVNRARTRKLYIEEVILEQALLPLERSLLVDW
jgi:hypothetical protein